MKGEKKLHFSADSSWNVLPLTCKRHSRRAEAAQPSGRNKKLFWKAGGCKWKMQGNYQQDPKDAGRNQRGPSSSSASRPKQGQRQTVSSGPCPASGNTSKDGDSTSPPANMEKAKSYWRMDLASLKDWKPTWFWRNQSKQRKKKWTWKWTQ